MLELLANIDYGGYISITKLIVFLILFLPLLPLLGWIYTDAEALDEKSILWTAVILAAAAAAILIWLFVPFFIIGMLFYLIATSAASLVYVKGRNSRVLESERVLTADHLKSLVFGSEDKKLLSEKKFSFITANKNEVPVPEPKTPDFYGYKTTYGIFSDAIWRRATSILLTPGPQGYNVIYTIDGLAVKQSTLSLDQTEYFIRFVKNLGNLDANEKRKPQKGKFKTRKDKDDSEWEVITAGSTAGEQIQINLASQQTLSRLEDLALTTEQFQQLKELHNAKQGIFIVSGPRKSGVTTTFYALLRNHDAFLNNINTLERNPSRELPNITQDVLALTDSGSTTFARKLESIIRMGPDIVGVADCKDAETAQLCCRAAKDHKLLYITMEADNVIEAFAKWLKLMGDKNIAAMFLLGISNQRIVRKLCEECRQAYMPDKELLRKFNIPADKAKTFFRAGKVQYDKRGREKTCEHCQGTGYYGRMGIFEIIRINDELRKTITSLNSLSEINREFRNAKMLYLQEQTLRKVLAGSTSINEMVRVFSKAKSEEHKEK